MRQSPWPRRLELLSGAGVPAGTTGVGIAVVPVRQSLRGPEPERPHKVRKHAAPPRLPRTPLGMMPHGKLGATGGASGTTGSGNGRATSPTGSGEVESAFTGFVQAGKATDPEMACSSLESKGRDGSDRWGSHTDDWQCGGRGGGPPEEPS